MIAREYFPQVMNPHYREASRRLSEWMRAHGEGDYEPVTEHVFGDGTYTRIMHLAADCAIVGKVHRRACTNILVQGVIRITSDDMEPVTLEAPYWFVSGAGVRKSIYAITDCIFMNVLPNPTNSRDPEHLARLWAADDYETELIEAPKERQ